MTSCGKIIYRNASGQVNWYGFQFAQGDKFHEFMLKDVGSKLIDEEVISELEAQEQLASSSNFETEGVRTILVNQIEAPAIGEAIAEAYLQNNDDIHWLWSIRHDVCTPNASLPGPDLVGFIRHKNDIKIVFGEVKTSSQQKKPPSSMYGSSGLIQQIIRLADDYRLKANLCGWLLRRFKKTEYEDIVKSAYASYLNPKLRLFSLYGVLVRDTSPDQADLKSGGEKLAAQLQAPTDCHLIALYLPCKISELTELIGRDSP